MAVSSVNGKGGNLLLPRTLPDPATVDTVADYTIAPTLTLGATSTIVSSQDITPDDGVFTYTADMAFSTPFPNTELYQPVSRYDYTWGSPPYYAVEFGTDAQVFEFVVKWQSAATQYRLSIDGRKVTDLTQAVGGTSAGSRYTVKFDLGSSAPRRIRIDFYFAPFGGIHVGPADSVWKTPFTGDRLMVMGDSITGGSDENTGSGAGTWAHRFARLLGYTDYWNHSIGGTGYVAAGGDVVFGDRVDGDVIAYAPDRIIIAGGVNDAAAWAGVPNAAREVFRAVSTGLDAYTVVMGCYSSQAVPSDGQTAVDEALRAEARAARLPFISPLTGGVYDASGALLALTGQWITQANRAGYVGADGVHPTDAGHEYIAHRMAHAYALLGNP